SASAFGVAHASDAEWVDVDGDGDLDLVRSVGESGHAQNAGPASLALNDGAGGLTPRSDFEVATWNDPNVATTGVAFLDVNLDGRQDLFFTRAQPGPGGASNLMLLGAGDGTFVDASASLPVFEDDSFDAIPLDLEGDGDMDLVVANSLIAISGADSGDVLVNQGFAQGGRVGSFLDAPGAIDEAPTFAEALRLGPIAGDVDLDGRIDVMMRVHDLPPGGHQPLFLGRGTQFERAIFPTGTMITAGGAFGDVDGDGDLDLLLTSAGSAAGGTTLGRALLYINQTR
ncbi:MAG: VCBS repeat-containing protein, partial [Planctomycetota bacterium]